MFLKAVIMSGAYRGLRKCLLSEQYGRVVEMQKRELECQVMLLTKRYQGLCLVSSKGT